MYDRSQRGEPSIATVLTRIADAGQRLILDRVDLAKEEARTTLDQTLRVVALSLAGASLALGGWTALMIALILWLSAWVPTAAAFAIVGAPHVVAGVVLLVAARRAQPGRAQEAAPDQARAEPQAGDGAAGERTS